MPLNRSHGKVSGQRAHWRPEIAVIERMWKISLFSLDVFPGNHSSA